MTEEREYLDALAGIAVNTLGHAHPKLVPAPAGPGGQADPTAAFYQNPLQKPWPPRW